MTCSMQGMRCASHKEGNVKRILYRKRNASITGTGSGYQFRIGRFLISEHDTFEDALEALNVLDSFTGSKEEKG